ncbi:MAG: type II toxin-antitoxin system HipA family toxin [Actinomycetota bacterium]
MTPADEKPGDELAILWNGERAGTLRRHRSRLSLTYEESWRLRDDATPMSLSMPLAAREHPHRVVEPFLWGLLPDNDAVLRRWGRDFQVATSHPFGLLANVGEDLAGAMQLVRPERVSELGRKVASSKVDWLETEDVAELLRTVRTDQTAWLASRADGRWSLAGAQPKIALLHEGGRWGRSTGRTPTTHILKPAVLGLDQHDLNEHLCLAASRHLGLRAAATKIGVFGEERAIVVERYDRIREQGRWRRVHQEDLCQALGRHPSQKYQSDGGPSPADIVGLLRASMSSRASTAAVMGFVDALAFNWLVAGPDAHAKNYAVLLEGPQVRLAPLYDIASALAYGDLHLPKVKLAMKVGGYYLLSAIGPRAWMRLAEDLRLDQDVVLGRVSDLIERVADAFANAADDPDVVALGSPLPARLLDAVAARAAAVAF